MPTNSTAGPLKPVTDRERTLKKRGTDRSKNGQKPVNQPGPVNGR